MIKQNCSFSFLPHVCFHAFVSSPVSCLPQSFLTFPPWVCHSVSCVWTNDTSDTADHNSLLTYNSSISWQPPPGHNCHNSHDPWTLSGHWRLHWYTPLLTDLHHNSDKEIFLRIFCLLFWNITLQWLKLVTSILNSWLSGNGNSLMPCLRKFSWYTGYPSSSLPTNCHLIHLQPIRFQFRECCQPIRTCLAIRGGNSSGGLELRKGGGREGGW